MIDISSETVERVHLLLSGLKNGHAVQTALRNAATRSMITARSESIKAIKSTYNILPVDLRATTKIKVYKETESVIEAGFEYTGYVIPLIQFKTDIFMSGKNKKKRKVRVSVMKASGQKTLVDAYVTNLGTYGTGIFERLTRKRETSQQLYGPSIAHMLESSVVISQVEKKARDTFDKRIEHEISRILAGYGGRQ